MRNIHDVINANDLAKRCITVVPGCENETLINAYKTKIAFKKYLKNSKPKIRLFFERFLGENSEYTAEKLFTFMYGANERIYKDKKLLEDFSQKSLNEVFRNFLEEKKEIGDCVGLTQAFSYLLLSKGIEPKILSQYSHILLGIEKKSKLIRLETTRKDGFNYYDGNEVEKWDYEKLESKINYNIGTCLLSQGDNTTSLKLLNKAVKLNPKDYKIILHRGNAYFKINDFDSALKDYNRAINLNSNLSYAYNNRGTLFFNLKNYEKALEDYNKAIELKPDSENSYLNRGNAHWILNQKGKALEDYIKYASFSDENEKKVSIFIRALLENVGEKKNELTR